RTFFFPSSFAFDIATVIPRSLKEPVGFSPSFLTWSLLRPSFRTSRLHLWSPVPPSARLMIDSLFSTGRSSLYFHTEICRRSQDGFFPPVRSNFTSSSPSQVLHLKPVSLAAGSL